MKKFKFNKEIIHPKDENRYFQPESWTKFMDYYKVKYEICKELAPQVIAEIGVRAGYSSWTFLQASPNAKMYGIDANNGMHGGGQAGKDGLFKKWAKKILKGYDYHYIDCDTQKVQSLDLSNIDFFHVDGDHTVQGVMHDLTLSLNCLSPKGVMLVDDIEYIPEVAFGVKRWLEIHKLKHEYRTSLRGECLIYKNN